MKALVVTKAGSAFENFELVQDIPKPSVEKNELLIKVEAAGIILFSHYILQVLNQH
jgi:NADPH:quinone reductase-like Zn-dependent oxidoreductase